MKKWLIREVQPKEMGKDWEEAGQGKEGNQERICSNFTLISWRKLGVLISLHLQPEAKDLVKGRAEP